MYGKRHFVLTTLVITIIVILILAGVTIATLTGENGLLSKTATARQRTEEAEQDEKDKLSSYEDEIDNYKTWERTGESEKTVTISEDEYNMLKNNASYSTTEQKIGTWIDGKTIYQKTININDYTTSDLTSSLLPLSGLYTELNLDKIISAQIMKDNKYIVPIIFFVDNNTIKISAVGNTMSYDLIPRYLTLQYTKNSNTN